jgi:hypothetical protein
MRVLLAWFILETRRSVVPLWVHLDWSLYEESRHTADLERYKYANDAHIRAMACVV